jgi:hypothetical protein
MFFLNGVNKVVVYFFLGCLFNPSFIDGKNIVYLIQKQELKS